MCVHREHRTGNCRACHPIVGLPDGRSVLLDNNAEARDFADKFGGSVMPQVWDGDNS